jgi:hypothetical protein
MWFSLLFRKDQTIMNKQLVFLGFEVTDYDVTLSKYIQTFLRCFLFRIEKDKKHVEISTKKIMLSNPIIYI